MARPLVPPASHTGGKWKPGDGCDDRYKGYRILLLGDERPPSPTEGEDPVAERISKLCASLASGLFDPQSLEQEQRRCIKEFPFVCRVCPFYSTQMSSFTWHLARHNGPTCGRDMRAMEMRCQLCSFSCERMADLIQHFNRERKRGKTAAATGTILSCEMRKPISCRRCHRKFRLRISLRIHFRREHSSLSSDSRAETRAAAVATTPPPSSLHPLLPTHTLVCPLCSSRLSTRGNLRQHMARHAPPESRSFRCHSCPRAFSVRADLRKHEACHSTSKTFRCSLCPHAAKSRATLRKHEKVHRSERPFRCKDCLFSCKLSSNLKRHQRIHSGEKPYACPHCEYRSGNQENLRKHILTSKKHEGLPVYSCDACSFGCNAFSSFQRHLKQAHGRTDIASIFRVQATQQS